MVDAKLDDLTAANPLDGTERVYIVQDITAVAHDRRTTTADIAALAASTPGGSSGQWQYNNSGAFGGLGGTGVNGTTNTPYSTYGFQAGNSADGGAGIISYQLGGYLLADHAHVDAVQAGSTAGLFYTVADDTTAGDHALYPFAMGLYSKVLSPDTDVVHYALYGFAGVVDNDSQTAVDVEGFNFYIENRASTADIYMYGGFMAAYNRSGAAVSGDARMYGLALTTQNQEATAALALVNGINSVIDLDAGATYTDVVNLDLQNNYAGGDAIRSSYSGSENYAVDYLGNPRTTGYMQFAEMTAPSAPGSNKVRIYAEDNGAGKTRLMALFPSGAAQQIAIEP